MAEDNDVEMNVSEEREERSEKKHKKHKKKRSEEEDAKEEHSEHHKEEKPKGEEREPIERSMSKRQLALSAEQIDEKRREEESAAEMDVSNVATGRPRSLHPVGCVTICTNVLLLKLVTSDH